MRAPGFWWRPVPTIAARLLAPAGSIYGEITARRMGGVGATLPKPVLCVGNLVAGGAGKTPTAIALAHLLRKQGHRPAFLSRGYGRAQALSDAVLAVDPLTQGVDDVGDEPLLLARVAPTFVGRNRVDAGRAAVAGGATTLVLDDGLQNAQLRKTVTLAVVDGGTGVGNGLCVPAGPLRAPLSAQWAHVSAVCVVGPGDPGQRVAIKARQLGLPVLEARLEPDPASVARLRGSPLLAFAGIGHPPKFFETLRRYGLTVSDTRSFPDHHRYSQADLDDLERTAARLGARLVTTEKDRVRLPASADIECLPVQLVFEQPSAVLALLEESLRTQATA